MQNEAFCNSMSKGRYYGSVFTVATRMRTAKSRLAHIQCQVFIHAGRPTKQSQHLQSDGLFNVQFVNLLTRATIEAKPKMGWGKGEQCRKNYLR